MAYIQLGLICDVVKGEIGITKAIQGDYPMVTTGEDRKSHNKFQLDTQAVLIPLVSATGHGHASIKRVHYQEGKFAFGSILAACVPKDKNYSAKFLYIYFNLMKDYVLVPLMKGSANVSLTIGNLKTAKVPKISLEIQLKTVELYSNIKIEQDKATHLLIKQKNDIKALRQSILQEAIQGKLTTDWRANNPDIEDASVLLKYIQKEKAQLIKDKKIKKENPLPSISKDEIPFELPKGWTLCHLNDLGIIGSSSRVHQKDWQTEGVPFYRAREIVKLSKFGIVQNNLFITEDLYRKFKDNSSVPEENDIMITGVGTIGIPYIVNKEDRFYFKDASVLIFKNVFNLYSEYLNLFFSSQYWINEIHKDSMGTTVHTLTISRAKLVPTIVPPLEEQKAIVQKVNALMSLCDAMEKQVIQSQKQSEKLMQSVLREVFETNNSL